MVENLTYEEALKQLEDIVQKLENNEIPLEESIALFQEGITLSKYCDDKLKKIQAKVAQIYENGELKDFQDKE